jgi:hypothetical protein
VRRPAHCAAHTVGQARPGSECDECGGRPGCSSAAEGDAPVVTGLRSRSTSLLTSLALSVDGIPHCPSHPPSPIPSLSAPPSLSLPPLLPPRLMAGCVVWRPLVPSRPHAAGCTVGGGLIWPFSPVPVRTLADTASRAADQRAIAVERETSRRPRERRPVPGPVRVSRARGQGEGRLSRRAEEEGLRPGAVGVEWIMQNARPRALCAHHRKCAYRNETVRACRLQVCSAGLPPPVQASGVPHVHAACPRSRPACAMAQVRA